MKKTHYLQFSVNGEPKRIFCDKEMFDKCFSEKERLKNDYGEQKSFIIDAMGTLGMRFTLANFDNIGGKNKHYVEEPLLKLENKEEKSRLDTNPPTKEQLRALIEKYPSKKYFTENKDLGDKVALCWAKMIWREHRENEFIQKK